MCVFTNGPPTQVGIDSQSYPAARNDIPITRPLVVDRKPACGALRSMGMGWYRHARRYSAVREYNSTHTRAWLLLRDPHISYLALACKPQQRAIRPATKPRTAFTHYSKCRSIYMVLCLSLPCEHKLSLSASRTGLPAGMVVTISTGWRPVAGCRDTVDFRMCMAYYTLHFPPQ